MNLSQEINVLQHTLYIHLYHWRMQNADQTNLCHHFMVDHLSAERQSEYNINNFRKNQSRSWW